MVEMRFDNREIDKKIADQSRDLKDYIDKSLEPLITQVTYTNGKMRRLTLVLTIIGTVTATLLISSGSELTEFILKVI